MTEPTEEQEASQHFIDGNEHLLGLHSTFVLGKILAQALRKSRQDLADARLLAAEIAKGLGVVLEKLDRVRRT